MKPSASGKTNKIPIPKMRNNPKPPKPFPKTQYSVPRTQYYTNHPIRLQVFLSHSGVCSRRKAMDIIQQGRVSVNNKVVQEPSTPVSSKKDRICVDGKMINEKNYEYILLNKPRGYITTKKDRFAEKTVLDLLPKSLRHMNPVGRLDKETEGLLLLTNDGELTLRLTHPRFHVEKTYLVKIIGRLDEKEKKRLEKGVVIDNKKTAPAKIKNCKHIKNHAEFLITIREGRKRQIRLMLQGIGHHVTFLKRVAQGPLSLGTLKTGTFRRLTKKEIDQLKKYSTGY